MNLTIVRDAHDQAAPSSDSSSLPPAGVANSGHDLLSESSSLHSPTSFELSLSTSDSPSLLVPPAPVPLLHSRPLEIAPVRQPAGVVYSPPDDQSADDQSARFQSVADPDR